MTFPRVPDSLSGTLLAALPIVVLDTETTGLDAAKDRVIEIGAYRPVFGRATEEADVFAMLVNPGLPIREASTRIHGITDADVTDAVSFPEAMAAFTDWAGPCILVGYSIGFDVAVLKAEHERAGLPWRPPRSLCVRLLTQLVVRNLPNPSLETTAEWLGVEITNRHRALGDALITGRLFQALLPALREKGIRTLAEAERACRTLSGTMMSEIQAGWVHPEATETGRSRNIADFARIDSFPYRHRVGDLMKSPPITIPAPRPLREALSMMVDHGISSLIVTRDAPDSPPGIVTERDILRAIQSQGGDALERPVETFATSPLICVHQEEFVYRALARMTHGGFRHLGVSGPDGGLVGVLSARDLLRQRADDAISLDDGIENAQSPEDLARVWSKLTTVAGALVYEDVDARSVATLISRELRALTQRACHLAESEMLEQGLGPPPVPYAMMVLGSGGRGESLLAMDQDNAIVFPQGAADGPEDRWLAALGKRVADILNDVGVTYCKGGIMASNAAWRRDVSGWNDTVGAWISKSRPEDILNCDIFFDARPVYGVGDLADQIRANAIEKAKQARTFLSFLALNASGVETPIGWFGRMKLQDGRIDLKWHGILPIISAARVASLQLGIGARSTPKRLLAAKEHELASERTIDNLVEAHSFLLRLILAQQLRDLEAGVPLSNKVAPGDLSDSDRQEMKWSLEQVPRIQDLLGTPAVG